VLLIVDDTVLDQLNEISLVTPMPMNLQLMFSLRPDVKAVEVVDDDVPDHD